MFKDRCDNLGIKVKEYADDWTCLIYDWSKKQTTIRLGRYDGYFTLASCYHELGHWMLNDLEHSWYNKIVIRHEYEAWAMAFALMEYYGYKIKKCYIRDMEEALRSYETDN